MRIIGLTGGIGSGKSTVTEYLISRGYKVLDADKISREIVEPGSVTLEKLTEAFGRDILLPDGSLDRKTLARLAFSSPEKKAVLNRITHDKILEIILARIKEYQELLDSAANSGLGGLGGSLSRKKVIFVDVPLLYESGLDRYMNEVWVVDAREDVRVERVMKRDQTTMEQVKRRIENQMDDEERLARADEILDNSGSREELYRQIERLLRRL